MAYSGIRLAVPVGYRNMDRYVLQIKMECSVRFSLLLSLFGCVGSHCSGHCEKSQVRGCTLYWGEGPRSVRLCRYPRE